ncbi:MAG: D-Ala-D-Ala carboxypeptidase family metallohydrolase [Cyanobacteria bacterium J06631_12]
MRIRITQKTIAKALPVAVELLKGNSLENQLAELGKGAVYELINQIPFAGPPGEDGEHVLVQVEEPIQGQNRWFIPSAAAQIEGNEPDNNPKDSPDDGITPPSPDFGPTIQLPGISRPVGIYEPVYFEPARCNFTWSEFTKGGTRIPVNATITQRLVKLARYMDGVRKHLGDRPIRINSGYRDPATNRRVGGARSSRHMSGDAVDFWVEGMAVVDVFYKLKTYHLNGGLAVGNGFVHLDLRPGPPARWLYPGGPQVDLW